MMVKEEATRDILNNWKPWESSGTKVLQTEPRNPKSWKIVVYSRCRKTATVAGAVGSAKVIGQEIHTYIHITEQSNPLWAVIQVSTISASSTFSVPSNGTTGTSEISFCTLPGLQKILESVLHPFLLFPRNQCPYFSLPIRTSALRNNNARRKQCSLSMFIYVVKFRAQVNFSQEFPHHATLDLNRSTGECAAWGRRDKLWPKS